MQRRLLRYIKGLMTLVLLFTMGGALQAQDHLLVYRKGGKTDSLLLAKVARIAHQRTDLQGTKQNDYVSMLVTLTDGGKRQYLLSDLDSVIMQRGDNRYRLTCFYGAMNTGETPAAKQRRTSLHGNFTVKATPVDFYWDSKDKLYLDDNRVDTLTKVSADSATASFYFGGAKLEADSYTVYYKGQLETAAYNQVRVAKEQTQTLPDNSKHIALSGDCGTATATKQDDGTYKFTLTHHAAYLCFLPSIGNDLKRTVLKQITVRSDSAIAGLFTLSSKGIKALSDTTHAITLKTGDFVLPKSTDQSAAAYLVLAPKNGATRLTATFTVYDTLLKSTGTVTKVFDLSTVNPNTVYVVKAILNNYVIDLGPVKVLNHNLGATAPEEPGAFYAYGETKDKASYWTNNYSYQGKRIADDIKGTKYDVAQTLLGGLFSLPNLQEARTLIDSCTYTSTTINGRNGLLLTSKKNSNTVFLPFAGCRDGSYVYDNNSEGWLTISTMTEATGIKRWQYHIASSTNAMQVGDGNQYVGISVRPVISKERLQLDGTPLLVTTDSAQLTYRQGKATLYGTLGELAASKTTLKVGFVTSTKPGATIKDDTVVTLDVAAKGSFSKTVDIPAGTALYYKAYVQAGDSVSYGRERQTGLAAVDLGLPSGTKWANANVYASSPELMGQMYAYGDTAVKQTFTTANYRWIDRSTYLLPDNLRDIQATRNDPISKALGGVWMTPNETDMNELINNCSFTDVSLHGMPGQEVKSKKNSATIFLPKSGYKDTQSQNYGTGIDLQSSNIRSYASSDSYELNNGSVNYGGKRTYGYSARAVWKTNAKAANGTPLFIRTLPARKQYDGKTETDTLVAVVRNISNGGTGNTLGFVYWPSTPTRDKGTTVKDLTADKDDYITTVIRPTEAGQTIHFCAFVNNGKETVYGDTLDITTVGLVDLGLSVKWANVNLGSANEGDPGTYYTFGGTKPFRRTGSHRIYGKSIEVGSPYDAATNEWGTAYRMPSQKECEELISNCTWTKATRNGVDGYLLTSKKTGYTDKSIFIPYCGWYSGSPACINSYNTVGCFWTSTINPSNNNQAVDLATDQSSKLFMTNPINDRGIPIRAVSPSTATVTTLSASRTFTSDVESDILNGYALNLPTSAKVGFLFGDKDAVKNHTITMTEVSGSVNGKYTLEKTGLEAGKTYYYCAAYTDGTNTVYGELDSLTTVSYVDLGLPSKTLWANVNVGAANPLDYGEYYAWGETKPKDSYYLSNYAYYKDGAYQMIGYKDKNSDGSNCYNIAGTEYDAATVNYTGYACTPTQPQCLELVKNCTWTHVTINGVGAIKFTSKVHPDRYILLPDAGRYSADSHETNYGAYMTATGYDGYYSYQTNDFWTPNYSGGPQCGTGNKNNKYYGMTVRPVLRKNVSIIDNRYVYLTTNSCYEQIGATTATLYGTMKITNATGVTYGFILGDSLNIDATHNAQMVAATNVDANGKYSVDASFGTAKFYRAYVKVGDNYVYGKTKIISAAKILAIVFNNDSSLVLSNDNMSVKKIGKPTTVWDDTYHRYVADLSANTIGNSPANFYRVYLGDDQTPFQKSFSLEVLMNPAATTSSEADAVSTFEWGGFGIGMSSGKWYTTARFNGSYQNLYGDAPTANQWTHAVMSWDKDKGTLTFYVNGTLVATKTVSGMMQQSSYKYMAVGGNPDSGYESASNGWSGKIGFANIYDQTLSADEVKTLYSNLTK